MKRTKLLCAIAVLLAVQLACISGGRIPNASSKPIGSIRQLKGGVRAGPESALQDVSPARDMYDNDAAQVYNQGKAELDYGYGITFTLYNDTATGGTSASASGQVQAKLAQGGLLGHNPPGARTEVQLPNGGSVIILGTTYSIDYNPATGVARVYNYDGSLQYSVGGAGLRDLPAGTLVIFDRREVLELIPDLNLTPDEYDRTATDLDSPLAAMDVLIKDRRAATRPQEPPPDTQKPTGTLEGDVVQFTDCRYGPGEPYLSMYAVKEGERVQVIGRDAGGRWLQMQIGGGVPCWINEKFARVGGDVMRLPDAYPFTNGLPPSGFSDKITVFEAVRKGDEIIVLWAGQEIPKDLIQAGLARYIVEVWTCVDGRPGFFALGTEETTMQFRIDESCGAPWHADVIAQDSKGFSPPAEIVPQ